MQAQIMSLNLGSAKWKEQLNASCKCRETEPGGLDMASDHNTCQTLTYMASFCSLDAWTGWLNPELHYPTDVADRKLPSTQQ